MTLSKLKRLNKKKWKHELRRKKKRIDTNEQSRKSKIVNKRMRAMMIQGRREHLAKRRKELDYINSLKAEVIENAN